MKCIEHTIKYKSTKDVIKIKPICDVHWGARHCDEKAFKRYISEYDQNTYFLVNGDLFDLILYHDTRRYRQSMVKDSFLGQDDVIDLMIDEMHELLEPIQTKIIGIGSGNHEDTIAKWGTDPLRRLCTKLSTPSQPVPFLGYSSMINLTLTQNGSRGRKLVIRMHHGWGGGSRTQGADLTKFSKDMAHWDAQIYIYGHVHRKQFDSVPRLGMIGKKLYSKPQLLVIGGTFLKTYSDGHDPTYSEAKGYPPTDTGGLTINIKPNKDWVKYWVEG
jgi:hypothetical protein